MLAKTPDMEASVTAMTPFRTLTSPRIGYFLEFFLHSKHLGKANSTSNVKAIMSVRDLTCSFDTNNLS